MRFPLNKEKIYITSDSESFKNVNFSKETEIPIQNHVGAFGTERKHHCHEGVDLYCEENEEVFSIIDGVVVFIEDFTGEKCGSPWWNDTRAVHVQTQFGVIVYGEIIEESDIKVGTILHEGELIGRVKPVLKKDKGRPLNMLHLELYEDDSKESVTWNVGEEKPLTLKDPYNIIFSSLACSNIEICTI